MKYLFYFVIIIVPGQTELIMIVCKAIFLNPIRYKAFAEHLPISMYYYIDYTTPPQATCHVRSYYEISEVRIFGFFRFELKVGNFEFFVMNTSDSDITKIVILV